MGCCGNGRRELYTNQNTTKRNQELERTEIPTERSSRTFEYTGSRSLKLKGITGKLFYFRFPGYRIEVPYEDSFALMAEADLKVVGDK